MASHKRTAEPETPVNSPTKKQCSSDRKPTPKEVLEKAMAFIKAKGLDKLDAPVIWKNLSDESKKRLTRLLKGDITWNPNGPEEEKPAFATTFETAFDNFCAVCPAWRCPENVFWDTNAKYLVIRCQRSGLCYMHAVVVLVHYLIALATGTDDHQMVDIAACIRDSFPTAALRDHICSNRGGRSIEMLKTMAGLQDKDLVSYMIPRKSGDEKIFESTTGAVVERFKRSKRPALVSGFKVETAFKNGTNGSVPSFSGEISSVEKPNGRHAMVLVGVRCAPDNDEAIYFLLQNWWPGKFLVEVTAEYLASTGATITFVDSDVKCVPSTFKTIDACFAETDETPLENDDEGGPA